MDRQKLQAILDRARGLTIALVGDLFLDRYLEIAAGVHEWSIETGLEAYQVERVRNAPGALGTVMNNLAALGVGRMLPVTVIGDDGHGDDLLRSLRTMPVDAKHILRDPRRLTPTYTKPLVPETGGHRRELNRLDVRTRSPLAAETVEQLIDQLEAAWQRCDGLIVLDQVVETNWGVVNNSVREVLERLAARSPDKLMYVDSRAHLHRFRAAILKGNRREITAADAPAKTAAPSENDNPEAATAAARKMAAATKRTVYCTCGEAGIFTAMPDGAVRLVPGYRVAGPVDIVGAGDAASSGIVVALLGGATQYEAALVGNLAASITVQQLGTTGTASPQQMLARLDEYRGQHGGI